MSRITVRVSPSAPRNDVVRYQGGVWYLQIAAAPDKGKANRALIDFLGDKLDVPRSAITIKKGLTAHTKVLEIEGITDQQIADRLGHRPPMPPGGHTDIYPSP